MHRNVSTISVITLRAGVCQWPRRGLLWFFIFWVGGCASVSSWLRAACVRQCICMWARFFCIIKGAIWLGHCAQSHFSVSLLMFPSIAEAELTAVCAGGVQQRLQFVEKNIWNLWVLPGFIFLYTFLFLCRLAQCCVPPIGLFTLFLYKKCEKVGFQQDKWINDSSFPHNSAPLVHLSLVTSVQAGIHFVIWLRSSNYASCSFALLSFSQGSLWAHATWMFAGSLLTSRGVSWSSAPGRMTAGCWTSRWAMLTSQASCPMENGT